VPLALRPTSIADLPEIVRAPLVVKVPNTTGNVEKSNIAVMVTGVGVEADTEGIEPIVKKAIIHSAIAAVFAVDKQTVPLIALRRSFVVFFVFVFMFVCGWLWLVVGRFMFMELEYV
jgi:hypothetical protein